MLEIATMLARAGVPARQMRCCSARRAADLRIARITKTPTNTATTQTAAPSRALFPVAKPVAISAQNTAPGTNKIGRRRFVAGVMAG